MVNNWRSIPLGDLISLQRGHDLPSQDRVDGAVPIMGSSGITGYHGTAKCKGPGVVVGRSGNSMGVVSYCEEDYWPLNTALYVTDFKGNDPRYISYLLSLIDFDQFNSGSAQKSLNRNAVYPYKVWATTNIDEQRAIRIILERYEKKIELNRQINTTLESMAQALFKSWFVDFDPVIDNALAAGNPIPEALQARADKRAGLRVWTSDEDARRASATEGASQKRKALHHQTGRTDQAAPLQLLPADIRALFPDSFVFNEEMGWVPEGWRVSTVGDEIETVGGGTPSTKNPDFWEGGCHPFCTPKDMSGLGAWVIADTERHLTDEGVEKISSGQLPAGVVLMSSRAPIGYLAISSVPVSINQGIIALQPTKNYSSMYLLLWAMANMDKVMDRANGSTFLEISKKNFRPIPFLVPSEAVLGRFSEIASSLENRMHLLSGQSDSLARIRDGLLPKLLSGELRLGEAGRKIAEAM